MSDVGIDSSVWLKLLLFLVIIGGLLYVFNMVMRRVLKVEKKKPFSHNHVNALHKKIDWTIRITFTAAMIIGYIINMSRQPEPILLLQPYVLLFMFILFTEIVRAIMEWKYAENRKAYILTMAEVGFIALIVSSIFMTDYFSLFG